MPSFDDFQLLVDWCTEPSPLYELEKVVAAVLKRTDNSSPPSTLSYEGDLVYRPPHAGLPELSGQLTRKGEAVNVAMYLGSTNVLADFTWPRTWDEVEVDTVEVRESLLLAVNFNYLEEYSLHMFLWGGYRFVS